MNDLEIDIKKGLHLYADNADLTKEGNKLLDENTNERKDVKGIDDQKNMIRKILHKIKNALSE
jgi:cell division protein FtsB